MSPKLQKGIHAARKGDLRRAATMFKAVLKSDPDNSDALNLAGTVEHQLGDSERAIKLIRRSLKLDPENALAHNNLGTVLKESGRDTEAIDSYRKALEYDPLNVECLNNFGVLLRNASKFKESISTLTHALEIAPEMAELHHNVGVTYVAMDQMQDAQEAFLTGLETTGDWLAPRTIVQMFIGRGFVDQAAEMLAVYLKKHPNNDSLQHHLAALRGDAVDRASDAYVTGEFDNFADSFDEKLASLDYKAPELVAAAVAERLKEPQANLAVLDLGCGTGLCGPLIADYKSELVGIDLSGKMMRHAETRGCYDTLKKAELQEFLETQPASSFDLVICADTLVYLGALERVFAGVAHVLRPGGLFVATVEAAADDAEREQFIDTTGRFKHKLSYLKRLSAETGFEPLQSDRVDLRSELRVSVVGHVFSCGLPA